MFDKVQNAERLAASKKARKELGDLLKRSEYQNRYDEVVNKRIARSMSRAIDIFDDCLLMYSNKRLTSSIILARSFFEQAAYTTYILHTAQDHRANLDALELRLIEIDNSSEQRKRLFRGEPNPEDVYTEAALAKFGQKTPAIPTADLVASLQRQLEVLRAEEGNMARLIYSALSEWSHPTLFSVVHVYTKDIPSTVTSVGALTADEVREGNIIWCLSQMMMLYLIWANQLGYTSDA